MRCHICDKTLGETEVSYSEQHDEFNPCGSCLQAISEVFEDHLDEDEITFALDEDSLSFPDETLPLKDLTNQ